MSDTDFPLTDERMAGIRQRAEQDIKKQGWKESATARDLLDLLDHVTELREAISGSSVFHTQWWQLPVWCESKEDVEDATDKQLQDLMGMCHVEGGTLEPEDCLACYAYAVACAREDEAKKEKLKESTGFTEGCTATGPGGTFWRVIKITEKTVQFSGPQPARGITTVKHEDLGDWSPVVPA